MGRNEATATCLKTRNEEASGDELIVPQCLEAFPFAVGEPLTVHLAGEKVGSTYGSQTQ
jgi:hypothetical protein